jgi:ABC-type transport system involved in multi-copper enzyme maturation permease subunit
MASGNALMRWSGDIRGWFANHAAWSDRFVNLALAIGTGLLVWLTLAVQSFWLSIAVWGLYIAFVAVGTQQGWLKMLGPVLIYDMIRTSRRNRYFILRMIYAGFLFFILSYMFAIAFVMSQDFMGPGGRDRFDNKALAVLCETFFMFFMLIQITLVVLLTPAYVAGAIAEEKDRKTMEFMLATDLRDREIIFSKFLSRLANMGLLLITGLPILSILQFIGGVDPGLMLAGFAATALTMLGIGSLSILFSVLFKKPRDAISLTYLMLVAYGAMGVFVLILRNTGHWLLNIPVWFNDAATIGDLMTAFNAGNPIAVIWEIMMAIRMMGLSRVLPDVLTRYAWFHLTVTVICITWSIVRLRSIALKQSSGGSTAKLRWYQKLRPRIGNQPMIWKEIFIESGAKLNWLVWIAVIILVLLTLGTGVFIVGAIIYDFLEFGGRRDFWRTLNEAMNVWFRIAGDFVGCILLLRTGVRAATTVTTERERDTMDALITTPMSAEVMLFAKLVGNLTSLWAGWAWYGSMMLLALLTGGLNPFAVPVLLLSLFVYSVVVTMIGLAFSIYCRSSLQASILTVLVTLFVGGGHWILTSCLCMPIFGAMMMILQQHFGFNHGMMRTMEELGLYFVKFQAGMTPPFVFAWNAYSWRELENWRHGDDMRHFWEFTGASIFGLFLWMAAAVLLWFFILMRKFRQITRRIELEE